MKGLASLTVGGACALVAARLCGVSFSGITRMRTRRSSPHAQQWLRQAGVRLSVVQFALGSTAVAAAAFVLIDASTGSWLVAVVPGLAAGAAPRAYFARRRYARLGATADAWPDGLRDLLASISAGRSLTQAVESMARNGPDALREAFVRFPGLARAAGTVAALEAIREELADPTSDRVIEVLTLAHEQGGTIVRSILEELVAAITDDLRLREELRSAGLEMKINARAVVALPWLVLVALTVRAGPFRDFYRSTAGSVVIVIGLGLSGIGIAVISRLGAAPVEPRVLGAASGDARMQVEERVA